MLFLYSKQCLTKISNINYRLATGLTLSLVLVSCAQTPKMAEADTQTMTESVNKTPHWVTAQPQDDDAYFYAIGESQIVNGDQGKAEQTAASNAQAALKAKLHAKMNLAPSSKVFLAELVPGDLENKLRARVQNKIDYSVFADGELESVYVDSGKQMAYTLVKISKENIDNNLLANLTKLDAQLRDYENASQKGSQLAQLVSLLPALPTLEAREKLHNTLKASQGSVPALPNDQMAFMMDRQITRLFDELVITIDGLTAETSKLAPQFAKALSDEGFFVSARRPDIALRYYIEMDRQEEGSQFQVTLTNDIEFINRDSTTVATFNKSITETAATLPEAESKAMATLAANVKEIFLEKMEEQITAVNKLNFGR